MIRKLCACVIVIIYSGVVLAKSSGDEAFYSLGPDPLRGGCQQWIPKDIRLVVNRQESNESFRVVAMRLASQNLTKWHYSLRAIFAAPLPENPADSCLGRVEGYSFQWLLQRAGVKASEGVRGRIGGVIPKTLHVTQDLEVEDYQLVEAVSRQQRGLAASLRGEFLWSLPSSFRKTEVKIRVDGESLRNILRTELLHRATDDQLRALLKDAIDHASLAKKLGISLSIDPSLLEAHELVEQLLNMITDNFYLLTIGDTDDGEIERLWTLSEERRSHHATSFVRRTNLGLKIAELKSTVSLHCVRGWRDGLFIWDEADEGCAL